MDRLETWGAAASYRASTNGRRPAERGVDLFRTERGGQVLSLGTSLRLLRKLLSDNTDARALTQGGLQVGRAPMLLQQVSECLVGKLLEVLHLVARQQIERVPRLVVKLDPLAWQ
jgi:hypothetical protein